MKKNRKKAWRRLNKAIHACCLYGKQSWFSVVALGDFFGKNKLFWYIAFSIQPLLAMGQLVFGYSYFFLIGYIIFFNFLLIKKAKKRKESEGK